MRKITLLLLLTLTITNISFAGKSTNTRNKCKSFAKRYAANAHLSTSNCGYKYTGIKHDKGCEWAEVYASTAWCSCATASEVDARADGAGERSYLKTYCGTCGASFSELYQELMPDGEGANTDFDEASQSTELLPTFLSNTITLSGISIVLNGSISDSRENSYEVAAWLPQDDEINLVADETYESSKAIMEGKVTLQNGILSVSGDLFSLSDFQVSESEGRTIITYIGGSKIINIPGNVTTDDFAVYTSGDIKPVETALFKSSSSKNNGVLEGQAQISIFPNPAYTSVNVEVDSKDAVEINLKVYDVMGKLLSQEKNPVVSGKTKINLDLSKLAPGQYYLLAEGTGIKIVKQFSKQ